MHHMDAFTSIKECHCRMEAFASKDKILLVDITTDFFGEPVDVSDKILWTLDGDSDDDFSKVFKDVLAAIMIVVQRQYSVLPRLLLQGAAPCPFFVTPCPFEKAEMTPCPFD